MKKSHLIGAVCACVSFLSFTSATAAGLTGLRGVGTGIFSLDMYDPSGNIFDGNTGDSWSLDFDNGTGLINNTQQIFGNIWFAHDLTFADNGDGSYSGNMLVDYAGTFDIEVTFDWVIDLSQVILLDGDNDGVPGNAMTSGPFPGITPAFYGTLTGQYVVPVPAAVWLFGSGLMGLTGIARRKNTT